MWPATTAVSTTSILAQGVLCEVAVLIAVWVCDVRRRVAMLRPSSLIGILVCKHTVAEMCVPNCEPNSPRYRQQQYNWTLILNAELELTSRIQSLRLQSLSLLEVCIGALSVQQPKLPKPRRLLRFSLQNEVLSIAQLNTWHVL